MFWRLHKYKEFWTDTDRYKLIKVGEDNTTDASSGYLILDSKEDSIVVLELYGSQYKKLIKRMLLAGAQILEE